MDDSVADNWASAWSGCGACGDGAGLRHRLWLAYDQPHRHYHSRQHLRECLALLAQYQGLAERPAEVAVALWFHDAVYDLRAHDNEARSAEWAWSALQEAGVEPAVADRVRALVLATRHDQAPATSDEALLVDIDLAILGASPTRFDEYEQQIRAEYRWVPGWLFRRKRRELLSGFAQRPMLYQTAALQARFEAPARANLRRVLA